MTDIETRFATVLLEHSPPNWDYHDACFCGASTPTQTDYCKHLATVLVKELGLAEEFALIAADDGDVEEFSSRAEMYRYAGDYAQRWEPHTRIVTDWTRDE